VANEKAQMSNGSEQQLETLVNLRDWEHRKPTEGRRETSGLAALCTVLPCPPDRVTASKKTFFQISKKKLFQISKKTFFSDLNRGYCSIAHHRPT
jgi:hypothetical protein